MANTREMATSPPVQKADKAVTADTPALQIEVNGEARRVPRGTSVAALLDLLELRGRRVAVARNRRVVPRSAYTQQILENGDRFEILDAVGGG